MQHKEETINMFILLNLLRKCQNDILEIDNTELLSNNWLSMKEESDKLFYKIKNAAKTNK